VVCNGVGVGDGVLIATPAIKAVVCRGVCVGADGRNMAKSSSRSSSKFVGGYLGRAVDRRASERITDVIELKCMFVVVLMFWCL
jgi:hypothetical protein